MPPRKNYPKTLPEAVDFCLKTLKVETLAQLAELGPGVYRHLGLGMWVRNNLGLWQGNAALMESMGCGHPDEASRPIVEALIRYLKKHRDWRARCRALRAPRPKQ